LCKRQIYPAKEPDDFFNLLRRTAWNIRGARETIPDNVLVALTLAAPMDPLKFRSEHLGIVNKQFQDTTRSGRSQWGEAFLEFFRLYPDVYLAPQNEAFLLKIIRRPRNDDRKHRSGRSTSRRF
jgi:hypothetical protein